MAYSGVYVFGDSLVDAGNALKLAEWYGGLPFTDLPEGAPTAGDGYYKGRFSDGYVFTDLISNKAIGVVTQPVFPYGFEDPWLGIPIAPFASDPNGNNLNFAYGGSQIRNGDEVVPDLDGQTDTFKDAVDGHAPTGALYMITMGGNDVRSLAPASGTPASIADAHSALDKCADQLLHELGQLVSIGARNIVISGIPDVGLIPAYDLDGNGVLDATELMRSEAATEYSQYLDTLIRTEVVPALQAMGATVTYIPLMDYTDAYGNEVTGGLSAILPGIAALHGLTTQELEQHLLQYQDLVFFDDVHPNAQVEGLISAYMYSQITGTPWIETMPLAGADVDLEMTASIGAVSEVDSLNIYLVAGTTYTFEMLGVSSLGAGYLADPSLRLIASGAIVATDDDSGAGLDANLTYLASASGIFTLNMMAVGSLTGSYEVQAAVVSGAAMQAGNIYTVTSASTLVLEGAGGVGQDVIKTSVSYALSPLSEIEVLRTTNDHGRTAINLTGNDFNQTIVGNSGNNILEGKGGADVMTGGGGNDVFVLSPSAIANPASIDTITDYRLGDVVDVTQILSVAAGVNVITGGYLRVTTSGHVQVDYDGGGNNWVTLSNINGIGSVAVRYLSGGIATNISVARVAETTLSSMSSAITSNVVAGAVAAAGLASETLASAAPQVGDGQSQSLVSHTVIAPDAQHMTGMEATLAQALPANEAKEPAASPSAASTAVAHSNSGQAGDEHVLATASAPPSELLQAVHASDVAVSPATAHAIAMPSAAMLQPVAEAAATGNAGRVLADALHGGSGEIATIDHLLASLPGNANQALSQALASHGLTHLAFATFHALGHEAVALHQDAHPIV